MDEQNQQNQQSQNTTPESKSQTGPIVAIVGLIVIVVVGVLAFQNFNNTQTQTQNTAIPEQTVNQQQSTRPAEGEQMEGSETAFAYKDGTYNAIGNYTSPGGAETIGVTLTIANGVVTDSQVEVRATRPMSVTKQTEFSENYQPQVVGKNIDEIVLTKVAGSSLSPKGFNDAVEQIKAEAQAQS